MKNKKQWQTQCVDPVRGRLLKGYCAWELSPDQQRLFIAHMRACLYCEEAVKDFARVARGVKRKLEARHC